MKKVLVLGGTRFFGQHLVKTLLEKGMDVTLATRGRSQDPFGDSVKRVTIDRTDKTSLLEAFKDQEWDIIYDQICYASQDALDAVEVFEGKTKRYILTSSFSVYDKVEFAKTFTEEDFDPFHHDIIMGTREDFTYDEGKCQAEAVFFQKAPFPVVAVRIPIVLGENDYTERLKFYVEKVLKRREFYLQHKETKMNFISEQEAGDFLAWLSTQDYSGSVNACANGAIEIQELIKYIEETTQQSALYTNQEMDSPFERKYSWTMDTSKAQKWGYSFSNLEDWLPKLIDHIYQELS